MTEANLRDWLERYVTAWHTSDAGDIAALFTEDAVYCYRPYGGDANAVHGRDAIVAAWLDEGDPPGSWEASYAPCRAPGTTVIRLTTWPSPIATTSQVPHGRVSLSPTA
jgi:hypothetical protein